MRGARGCADPSPRLSPSTGRGGSSSELDIRDAVPGLTGDVQIGDRLASIPAPPQDQALPVGRDGRDHVGAGGDHLVAAVGAEVLGDELVVGAYAFDRS